MLPKVLCLLAITAFVASAPFSDQQYIDQLQKEYEDDRYDDTQTVGKIDDLEQQFQEKDEQTSELKDIEQYEHAGGDEEDEILEQFDDESGDEVQDIEQIDQSTGDELEDLEQIDQVTGDESEDIDLIDQNIGDEWQDIEQVDQGTGDDTAQIEQGEQEDDLTDHDNDAEYNGESDNVQQEIMDDLETDSAIGKLFGASATNEPEDKYSYDQDKQLPEVGREFNYEHQLPKEEEVKPSYSSNYGSGYSGHHYPAEPEPEFYTQKPLPWYKKAWLKTKEKARGFAHKVKETFSGK